MSQFMVDKIVFKNHLIFFFFFFFLYFPSDIPESFWLDFMWAFTSFVPKSRTRGNVNSEAGEHLMLLLSFAI